MKNVAIFGGSGFLGTHLQARLKARVSAVSLRNANWEGAIPADTEVFLNVVGKAHDHQKQASREDYWLANVSHVQAIFQAFLRSKAGLLIHISSIAVVEETGRAVPLTEQSDCKPESWYGQSKKEAEDFLLAQQLPAGKQLVILRPPMIYGAGDKGNLKLLFQFARKGFPYPLGAYNNQRSFISVTNTLFFIQQLIENPAQLQEKIYNIADDESVSTMDIIRIAGEVLHKKPLIVSVPRPVVGWLATVGSWLKLPLNKTRLNKMTSTLLVSNRKIKTALGIDELPVTAREALKKTFESFNP